MKTGTVSLPADWRARFECEGHLRLGRLMDDAQLETLRARIAAIIARREEWGQFRVQAEPRFAERAGQDPEVPWRKISFLDRDPEFLAYFKHPAVIAMMRSLIGPELRLHRAFALLKPAHHGSPLDWHQDAGPYFPAWLGRFYTVWTALDDADAANGALQVLPGTHHLGLLAEDRAGAVQRALEAARATESGPVVLDARAGEAFLLHNLLLHSSGPNPTPHPRRAITTIYVDADCPVNDRAPDAHRAFTRVA
jgi:ectoine hydroxylase-related dioxygenase (phytanoyl-CoA dioxygenase family)